MILFAAYHQPLVHFYFFLYMIFLFHRPPSTLLFLLMILISFFSHKDPVQLEKLINNELKKISNWFKENKLSLDIDKTNFIMFKNKHDNKPDTLEWNLTINILKK